MRIACVRIAGLFCAAALLLCGGPASADVVTWTVDGDMREAIVFAPASTPGGGKLPLVFVFHGHGDDMTNFQHSDMHVAWPEAIVVYFQGLRSRDGLRGWQVERGEYNDRDLKLVDAALASLRKRYPVDDGRVYATGFSNGATFTYLLWAERPDVFAAYAPVAGRLRPSVHPKQPRPLFHVAGAQDGQVPIADQRAAIAEAVRINGVARQTKGCGAGCTLHGAGAPAPVMAWIHGGGHEYPLETSGRIAAFFKEYHRTTQTR